VYNGNAFKLGLFALNCGSGLTQTNAPERWEATWDNNLRAVRLAEEAGLEFALPVARWHGYGGKTDTRGSALETLTWATALLAATERIAVFGTVHVALVNPIFAAKQVVTAHNVGHGRFGLNVVSGWNLSEFEMFGTEMREHDERYAFTEEWVTIVKRVWTENEPFDFDGRYFKLRGVFANPKPYDGKLPLLMSAGSSPPGRAFARRHADALFMVIDDENTIAHDIRSIRDGREGVGVFASGHLIFRKTEREAAEYYHYIVHEMGDWAMADHLLAARIAGGARSLSAERLKQLRERHLSGAGTYPLIGGVDTVVQRIKQLSEAGLDGMAIGLVNYIDEMPLIREELLPRLERLGLRRPLLAPTP
jgi:FMNH2-dependent dimethyl sulfone monooxygenase